VSRAPLTLALAASLGLAACGGSTPPPDGVQAPAPIDAGPPPDAAPIVPRREGTVPRAALEAVLAAGPGRFLGTLEVRARLVGRRFTGWEVVRAPWPDVDLAPGDVVVAVNRRTLERPLELQSLWAELATAPEVVAEVERGEERFALRFALEPAAPAAATP
jgi:S1-C subfamily serine protease